MPVRLLRSGLNQLFTELRVGSNDSGVREFIDWIILWDFLVGLNEGLDGSKQLGSWLSSCQERYVLGRPPLL